MRDRGFPSRPCVFLTSTSKPLPRTVVETITELDEQKAKELQEEHTQALRQMASEATDNGEFGFQDETPKAGSGQASGASTPKPARPAPTPPVLSTQASSQALPVEDQQSSAAAAVAAAEEEAEARGEATPEPAGADADAEGRSPTPTPKDQASEEENNGPIPLTRELNPPPQTERQPSQNSLAASEASEASTGVGEGGLAPPAEADEEGGKKFRTLTRTRKYVNEDGELGILMQRTVDCLSFFKELISCFLFQFYVPQATRWYSPLPAWWKQPRRRATQCPVRPRAR